MNGDDNVDNGGGVSPVHDGDGDNCGVHNTLEPLYHLEIICSWAPQTLLSYCHNAATAVTHHNTICRYRYSYS